MASTDHLSKIESPDDLKSLSIPNLRELADELRELIIDVVSKNGGHLAPSLGVVELTLALHYVFDSPKDRFIWDVGHQSYAHKILTGRKDRFHTLRQFEGVSGFTKIKESPHDAFGTGHSSTSLSAALGLAASRDLLGGDEKVIAVIGDGALTAGMAFEGLNQVGHLKKDVITILNDNEMSIAENVGALSDYLSRMLTSRVYNRLRDDVWELLGGLPTNILTTRARDLARKIEESLKNFVVPTILFEELGFRYIGPLNGHDLSELVMIFENVKKMKGPILIHVLTQKGMGYRPAEENPEYFHGCGPFDKVSGTPQKKKGPLSYTDVFGKTLLELAEKDEKVVGITAAMPLGTGLIHMREKYPKRFFDVGIAEQHAVTFAAGLALRGLKPFVAIYSTFLQRAFDQVLHDLALQNIPVRLCLDRGGLVGEDGPTHHGAFDLSYLRLIPNLVIMAPKDEREFRDMMYTQLEYEDGPIAVRYPRGGGWGVPMEGAPKALPIGKAEVLREGSDGVVLAVGSMVHPVLRVAEKIREESNLSLTVVNVRFIKPLDEELIGTLVDTVTKRVVTVEENASVCGFGSGVLEFLNRTQRTDVQVLRLGIPDEFIPHGDRAILLDSVGLSEEKIKGSIVSYIQEGRGHGPV
jgi:1-deoxy-D-xylulose-5-phosphate synthase